MGASAFERLPPVLPRGPEVVDGLLESSASVPPDGVKKRQSKRGGAGQRKDGGRERLRAVPSGSVAVDGIRLCGREEAVWWRSCSWRYSEAPEVTGERKEVG